MTTVDYSRPVVTKQSRHPRGKGTLGYKAAHKKTASTSFGGHGLLRESLLRLSFRRLVLS
jgi:hypothetical protein